MPRITTLYPLGRVGSEPRVLPGVLFFVRTIPKANPDIPTVVVLFSNSAFYVGVCPSLSQFGNCDLSWKIVPECFLALSCDTLLDVPFVLLACSNAYLIEREIALGL